MAKVLMYVLKDGVVQAEILRKLQGGGVKMMNPTSIKTTMNNKFEGRRLVLDQDR
jgi:hypothetical protein